MILFNLTMYTMDRQELGKSNTGALNHVIRDYFSCQSLSNKDWQSIGLQYTCRPNIKYYKVQNTNIISMVILFLTMVIPWYTMVYRPKKPW